MDTKDDVLFDVSIEDKLPLARTAVFGFQHLLALTGIWVFPILVGQALHLSTAQVSHIVQACFFTTGLVTMLQSSRILKLPVVQGPTGSFFLAVLTSGLAYGLGAAYGSMMVAGFIAMLLTLPFGGLGLMGRLLKYVATPIVYGVLLIIVGASLSSVGLSGWFGIPQTPSFGMPSFYVGCFTAIVVMLCMIFGGNSFVRRGALLWGVILGTLLSYVLGDWRLPDFSSAAFMALPQAFPFGFSVSPPLVLLMLLAFLQAGAEAMGIYTLLGTWGKQEITQERVHRGLFSEYLGCALGAIFGGLGTTSYPENIGIIRISKIASRFVTLTAGGFAIVLSLFPKLSLLIAGLPAPVLAAASTILFGIIAVSGMQMLARVEWDELNIVVAAPSFIISLGAAYIPPEILSLLPASVASFLKPMMLGTIMLIVLNIIVNHVVRPRIEGQRHQRELAGQA
jgi:uracil-xanthine permease